MKATTKSPAQFFTEIIKIASLTSGAVGCDISDPNFRVNWLTIVTFALISSYFIFTVMTIAKLFSDDWKVILEASCMMGTGMQCYSKLFSVIIYCKDFAALRYQLEELYAKYEKQGRKYRTVLNESCARVYKIVAIIGLNYAMAVFGICLAPFLLLAFRGQRYLMIHFHIPGVDIQTDYGYYGTLGMQSIFVVLAGFGLFAGDIFPIIYLMQSVLFADIFKLKIEELNDLLNDAHNRTSPRVAEYLIDIVQWHQLYSEFTKTCNKISYYIVSVQVFTAALSIVLTIFIVLASDWPVAYPYLIISAYTLYVYCILGTKIETCNEQFTVEIYNISWYNMIISHQKFVSLMLMKAQSPNELDVAGVMPLSVSTALQISKTIYTISMMMVQFLK